MSGVKFWLLSISVFINACSTSKMSTLNFAANPVVAHRGAFKEKGFPENSLASLKEAIRLGCTGAEFDVRMTADDTLIINHDPHFAGMDIEKTSYKELSKTSLSNGEKLPTLYEYLLAGMDNNRKTRLVLEIKPSEISKERGKQMAEKVLQLVSKLKAQSMLMYISFDYDMLKHIHLIDSTAHTQYLNGDVSPLQLRKDGINGADYHYSVFLKNPAWITEAKENKILLNTWTVNQREDMLRLLRQGFDYITTNEPGLLFDVFKAFKN